MAIKQFEIWIADLNPRIGTEPGKVRPVLVLQSDLLNRTDHPSTLICPITTKISFGSDILRIHLAKDTAGLNKPCDILLDQIRAIDKQRLTKRLGVLPLDLQEKARKNTRIVLDL